MKKNNKTKISIKNRKAFHNYEIEDTFVAGIALYGTEIKSIRLGKASLVDSFCFFHNGELYAKGVQISEYSNRGYANHEPLRERKLLLNKKELVKIEREVTNSSKTVVPIKLFITDKGWAKLEIGVAVGRKKYDKRENLKQKDAKRELGRVFKNYNN